MAERYAEKHNGIKKNAFQGEPCPDRCRRAKPLGMTNPSSICVLVSGGLDSAMLVKRGLALGHLVYPLYVASGFQWERAERHCLNQQLQYLSNPKLKALKVLSYPAKEFFFGSLGISSPSRPGPERPSQLRLHPGPKFNAVNPGHPLFGGRGSIRDLVRNLSRTFLSRHHPVFF